MSTTTTTTTSSSSNKDCEDDIFRIKKRLEKMMQSNEIDVKVSIDMLNTLKNLPIDLNILKNTGIGVSLNNLRKSCNSEELGTLTKNLLKNWKKLVANETTQLSSTSSSAVVNNTNNTASSPNSNSNDSSSKPMSPTQTSGSLKRTASDSPDNLKASLANGTKSNQHNQSSNDTKTESSSSSSNSNKSSTNGGNNSSSSSNNGSNPHKKQYTSFNPLARQISFTETKDPVRLKCREMLANALELTESIENNATLCDVNEIAGRCEDMIFEEFRNTDTKYRNRVRSRVINLKDANNPKLRENVRLGLITPDKLATMTSEEMASDELKKMRADFTKEAINDHQMARTQGAKTSLLKCGKCKKNNVVYSEMQTRSADEPMTTFAFCQECGHRWKFC